MLPNFLMNKPVLKPILTWQMTRGIMTQEFPPLRRNGEDGIRIKKNFTNIQKQSFPGRRLSVQNSWV